MDDFTECQVVFAHEVVWDAFQNWLRQRSLKTFPMPNDQESDLPTYGITFIPHQRTQVVRHDGWWACECGQPYSPEHVAASDPWHPDVVDGL